MKFQLIYIILIALFGSLTLSGQEVTREMLDFPFKAKQVDKMTAKLQKLNSKLEKRLTDLRSKITEQGTAVQVMPDSVSINEIIVKKDSLLNQMADLEAKMDSLGMAGLQEDEQYQELKSQIKEVDINNLSENELLVNGLDSLSNQLNFLMGQKMLLSLTNRLVI